MPIVNLQNKKGGKLEITYFFNFYSINNLFNYKDIYEKINYINNGNSFFTFVFVCKGINFDA